MKLSRTLLLAATMLGLTGCFGPVKTPTVKTYSLDQLGITQPRGTGHGVIGVAKVEASPGFDSEDMVYVKKPHQLEHFSVNQWIAKPADMLQPLLFKTLEYSGCFSAVVPSSYTSTPDITLNSHILVFQQEFLSNNTSQVRMTVNITLTNNMTDRPLINRSFTCVIPAAPNPYAGVVAANAATAEILHEIATFVCSFNNH